MNSVHLTVLLIILIKFHQLFHGILMIKEADIIVVSKKGNVQVYSITKNKQTIILDLIDRYIINTDTTKTDKIVNSYIDMRESM